jgi:segregation and condensation protein B
MASLADESLPVSSSSGEPSLEQLNDAFAEMLKTDSAQDSPTSRSDSAASEGQLADPEGDNAGPENDAPVPLGVPMAEGQNPVTPKRILEAMLFVGHPANEPLTAKQAATVIHGVTPREVEKLIEELCSEYVNQGCIYDIHSEGSGYRMVLRKQYEPVRDRFYGRVREAKLSQAAIEVLALVAYNQPTTSDKVNKLRGHPSGPILSQLIRRQLLCMERPENKPRTPVYRTTPRFLQLFGLASLEELPKSQELDS